MNRRDVVALGLATLSIPWSLRPAFAQSRYPERPIRLVIPFPPGGVNDFVGRPWAERVKAHLGTVVIENIGGAGGSIGAAAVARAQPDGYTILLGSGNTQVINAIASAKPNYHPLNDFESVAILTFTTRPPGRDRRLTSRPSCSSRWRRRRTSSMCPIVARVQHSLTSSAVRSLWRWSA